jgi:hypothetical protein
MLGPYNFGSDENEKLWRVWREEACALRFNKFLPF